MVCLNGISIKELKKWDGPQGIMWAGKLYLKDVNVAIWSNDNYDGPDRFVLLPEFDKTNFIAELKKRVEEEFLSADIFMSRLLNLIIDEKLFCEVKKQGNILLSISDGGNGIYVPLPAEYVNLSDEEIQKALIKELTKKLPLVSKAISHEIKIYRELSDFDIGEPIELGAIHR